MAKTITSLALFLAIGLVLIGFFVWHADRPTPGPHGVTLTWRPPPPKAGITIVGYNVYRRTDLGGPFVKIADHVSQSAYEDTLVSSGRTYIYAVTSVDQSGRESRYSTLTRATVP